MSRRDRKPEALVLDEGVLREGPVCEIGGHLAVEACGYHRVIGFEAEVGCLDGLMAAS